jgi:hypothetical protein
VLIPNTYRGARITAKGHVNPGVSGWLLSVRPGIRLELAFDSVELGRYRGI